MTEEEIMACLIMKGLTVADFDRLTYGMLINYAYGYNRIKDIAAGKEVPDYDARYQKLKAIEPLVEEQYENSEISESEYLEYKQALMDYERG
jgi:hypothetical protein